MIRSDRMIKFVQVGIGLGCLGYLLLITKFKSNEIQIENSRRPNQRVEDSHQSLPIHQTECDPYSEHGSLYSSRTLHESRYIIYNQSNHWIVPSYSSKLNQNQFTQLEWMKNKTIVLIGDSIDRNLVIHFGRRALKGTEGYHRFLKLSDQIQIPTSKLESHQIGISYLPELNLTIYNWFFMGIIVKEQVPFFHPREDLPQDYQSKLDKFYLPLLEQKVLPFPDLVIFNTGFWDLDYLARSRSVHHPLPNQNQFKTTNQNLINDLEDDLGDGNPLSLFELTYHRNQFKSFIIYLQKSLSKIQSIQHQNQRIGYLYRSMQFGNATQTNAFSPKRVNQINQSNLALVKEMRIKVLDWGKMTIGLERQLTDPPIHYGIGSAQYIFGDMMLFYLKQHVLGDQDEWIGCKWIKERRKTN